jgi:hypothetical protein
MRDEGRRIETQGELADIVGEGRIALHPDSLEPADDWRGECLCPVDIVKTMLSNGYRVRNGWDTAGCDWEAERFNASV